VTVRMLYFLLISPISLAVCDKLVPSSPEVFYGGFTPIIVNLKTESRKSEIIPEERKSRQLPFFEDEYIYQRKSRIFRFDEADAKYRLKKTFYSSIKNVPVHRDRNPKFPLDIPDKNKFTITDAIVGKPLKSEEEDDNVESEQFQLFNFLSNVRFPPMKFPNILNNMLKRPQRVPPNISSIPHQQRPSFSPSPQNNLNQNTKIPNHQHPSSHSQAANQALTVFNQGLDNFIQNPASLAHVPRPTNGDNNAPFLLPPGMSVEEKTKFLLNLDKDHQFFVSMPHMNAGIQNYI